MLGASYNATSVTENWTGPEKNAQSWGLKLNAAAEQDTARTNWLTSLKEEFGRTQTAGSDELTSADLIDLNSVYSIKKSQYVNPYVGFIATTQNWKLLNPVTYTESVGNGVWVIKKPTQELRTRAGLAFRQVYDAVDYRRNATTGLREGYSSADNPATPNIEELQHQTGGEWITNYMVSLNQNAKLESEARVFSEFNGGANLRWDNNLYVKLSTLVTMQLNYLWIYNYSRLPHPVWPLDSEKRLSVIIGFSYNLF